MSQLQSDVDANRALKRRISPSTELSFFTPSSETFRPKPYYSHSSNSVPRTFRATSQYRDFHRETGPPKPFDPTPDDPTAVFIHPPFDDFPNAHLHPEGLTYTLMAENPEWFLDAIDFKAEGDPNPNAIIYPSFLEPPRGWCPTKKKDAKVKRLRLDGESDEDAPTLRCTFCRRKYAGVNAKSMWRRHVLEKHKIPMGNRRDGACDNGRTGRTANKENKKFNSATSLHGNFSTGLQRSKSDASQVSNDYRGKYALLPPFTGAGKNRQGNLRDLRPAGDIDNEHNDDTGVLSPPFLLARGGSVLPMASQKSPELSGSMLPPSSPPVNISASMPSVTQASPFDPLKTPNFGRVLTQPWKFPSPSHPLHVGADELCLGVPVRGIAGEGLKGGYIPNHSSPFSLPHTSPSKFFSSPSVEASPLSRKLVTGRVLGWKRCSSDSIKWSLPGLPEPQTRQPSYTGPLPVPVTERFEFETPELSTDMEDFDSSFSSLNESFMSWFDMANAFGSPSKDIAKIIESSSSAYPDTPIKRSTDASSPGQLRQVMKGNSISSWATQPSGIGLGITMPLNAIAEKRLDADSEDEFLHPTTQEDIGPLDSPNTDDDANLSNAPPLKRRRTM